MKAKNLTKMLGQARAAISEMLKDEKVSDFTMISKKNKNAIKAYADLIQS